MLIGTIPTIPTTTSGPVPKSLHKKEHVAPFDLIKNKVKDKNVIWLVDIIIDSYLTSPGFGIPLGNITSQLFANVYLDELDKYIKQELKIKYYIRYCDDFLILDVDYVRITDIKFL